MEFNSQSLPGRIIDHRRVYLTEPATMRTNASIRQDAMTAVEARREVKYSAFPFEALNRKILNFITSPYRRADQIVTRFFLSKFVTSAVNDVEIAPETQEEILRLSRKSTLNVPREMSEGRYFVGVGKTVIRYPDAEEVRLIESTGQAIFPQTFISVYNKAVVNGLEYQIADNVNRKFCNSIVNSRTRFLVIDSILSYRYGEETVAGIIGRRIQDRSSAYGTNYMRHIVPSEETVFSSYHGIIPPEMTIQAPDHVCTVPLCNYWETNQLSV